MFKKSVKISKKLMGKRLDGEWVFLNLDNGEYYGLNETGSFIWDAFKAGKDREAILDCLQEIYGVDRDTLEKDLKELIKDLKQEGLVQIEDSVSKA